MIRKHWFEVGLSTAVVAAVGFVSVFIVGYDEAMAARAHLSSTALGLVGNTSQQYARALSYDQKTGEYRYNAGYQPSDTKIAAGSGPKFSAVIPEDATKPVVVTDPVSQLDVRFTPEFGLETGRQQGNHIVYPISHRNASKVYTLAASGMKEDIILHSFQGDALEFSYHVTLPADTEARMSDDGSVGVYGLDKVLLSAVSSGNESDTQLLAKAKQKAEKNNLLFSIPAPFAKEVSGRSSVVRTVWRLNGNTLTLQAGNLRQATYPLTLDPTIFVTSASDFMRGNNESNIDFDTSNDLIQKGRLTGARMNAWSPVAGTQDLPASLWNHGTVVAGGYIYVIGGSTGTTNQSTVYWAKLDNTTYTITSPNTGAGACSQWCTNATYNLPGARAGLAVAAYNGFLYAVAGFDGAPARSTSVYYAKIGANGEPVSWASTTALGTERSYASAVAYQNKLYLFGGQSNGSTGGITGAGSIQYGTINPDGTVTSWTNTTTAMPSARWGHTVLEYNGYFYLVGGASGTTTQNSVEYVKVGSSGDISSSWTATSSFTTARAGMGGNIAAIWGGYMYVSNGCTTVTATDCGSYYSTGTAYQSGTTVTASTGLGIAWTSAMVGMVITFSNGISATITAVPSSTTLTTANESQTTGSVGSPLSYTIDLNDMTPQVASINGDGSLSAWRTITLNQGEYYMDGTASQTTTAISGSGTAWDIDMIGQTITYANNTSDVIKGQVSTTSMIATTSRTVSSQAYTVTKGVYDTGGQVTQSGTAITGSNGAAFTSDMVGKTITIANGGVNTAEIITGYTDATHISVGAAFSQTISTASVFVIRDTHVRKFSAGFVAWRSTLYAIGGCAAMNGTGGCSTVSPENEYAHINSDGDVSQMRTETTMPSAGTSNTAGTVGRFSNGVVINNGYIYTVGGCGVVPCTAAGNMNANLAYAAIGSDGAIVTNGVTGCAGGATTWCVVQVGLNGTTGLGAFGITVYNNTIYVAGGGTGSAYQTHYFYLPLNADGSPNGTFTDNGNTAGTVLAGSYGYPFLFTRAASATTGNIYAIGGCTGTGGVGCSGYAVTVQKCTITNSTRAVSGCVTAGQTQLPTGHGIAISSNAVYQDYIYLCGGADGTGAAQTDTCYYAQIDNSNNIVPAPSQSAWVTTTAHLPQLRRRGTAFAANGYVYVIGGHDGSIGTHGSTLHDVVFAKIDLTTGNLTGTVNSAVFDSSTTVVTGRWNLGVAAANGYFYAIGGCTTGYPPSNCTATSGVAESIQVYNNYSGSPQSYTAASNLFTTDRYGAGAVAVNGYLYVAGGCSGTVDCQTSPGTATFQGDSAYVQINADGSLPAWTSGPSFPSSATRGFGCMVSAGGYLYYIGGRDGTNAGYAQVYYSQLVGGVPQPWSTSGTSFGGGLNRQDMGCAVFNNRIYVVGGSDRTPAYASTVYYSPALPTGGDVTSWTSTTAFTTGRSGLTVIAYGQTLYVLGGYDGTNYLLDVQYADINSSTGAIGTWNYGPSLPQAVRQGTGFAANGYLYVLGGRSAATTCTNNTYVASINGYPAGSTNRYGIGSWSQTIVSYSGNRFGAGGAFSGGRAYLLGGFCNATLTGANRVVYGALQAQPQLANYSLSLDTDTDVFPAKYLMNGVDNGTGAQWSLKYQSSNTANHVWGSVTDAGTVALGTPSGQMTYADTTTGERWYFFNILVDASQAFGYPEDVTRGPTINDITIEFSTDPGKRLHHGKTFTGGLLQPLDAPF